VTGIYRLGKIYKWFTLFGS